MKKCSRKSIGSQISNKELFTRISKWQALLFLFIPVSFIIIIFINFSVIYNITMENIKNRAESMLLKYSVKMNDYLDEGITVIQSMSYNVEDMFRINASSEDIQQYFIRESEALEAESSIHFTGIYGYVEDEYIDGYLWEPDEDYIPTKRPWYTEAVKQNGEIAYVEPYTDAMTGDTIMTMSKLLSDKKSVIAIDIKINDIQDITEALIDKNDDTGEVIIINEEGAVIVHSDHDRDGKACLAASEETVAAIHEKLLKGGIDEFSVRINNDVHMVYARNLGGGWYMLSMTDVKRMFARIFSAIGNSLFLGLAGTLVILYTILTVMRRQIEIEDFNIDLKSVSSIYSCMYKINLANDTFEEISCASDKIAALVGDRRENVREVMKASITLRVDERTREEVLRFTDLGSLAERMKDTDTLICEFMSIDQVWDRARFTAAERDKNSVLKTVIFTIEVIDKEKRDRDRLLYLSETDRLTGINNRGSGESKIRKQLLSCEGGMFILFDVDKFKYVNDNFGHDVGDKVLIAIADCMKRTFRNNDIVMRLGGDEFAAYASLVLSREGAEIIVDRLMKQIGRIKIPELGDNRVEVSAGVAFYRPEDRFDFDELYKRADKCTYESKAHEGSYVTYF
ncbi:MAG: GGDEF domain-containing protein [Lachnospiraceae bacterium]|nr:GGDEF domain-containing protein [Lachnospiraceae bacterium]